MVRFLKWLIISLVALVLVLFASYKYMQSQTKKHSPEQTISQTIGSTEVDIFYNRPSKKDRVIFGELVPFGEVWRTGANEATTFTTSKDLTIEGATLPAGSYTLWTIPGETEWKIIWNSHMYPWGVSMQSKASRNPEYDVVEVTVPVNELESPIEQFTIRISSENELILEWDRTQIRVQLHE